MSIFSPSPRTTKATTYPAPVKGITTQQPGYGMGPSFCVFAFNIMPGERGMTVRPGHRVHQTGLPSEVRTIVPLTAINRSVASDKMFSVCKEGIYDTSVAGETPVQVLAFQNASNGGYGHFVNYTNDAGDDLILYADSRDGLCIYTASTDTWAKADPANYTGLDPANVAFVMIHKLRVWLIERDSTDAYYLGVGEMQGTATNFRFGSKFKYGGELVGLYNMTMDGGDGVDDYLVAISRAGDVVVFRGEDPSQVDLWSLVGTFFVGEVPAGRRVANEYGGDVYIVSSFGLLSMAAVMTGVAQVEYGNVGIGAPIALLIRQQIAQSIGEHGWDLQINPSQGTFMVLSPQRGSDTIQYTMSEVTHGWGLYRGLAMVSGEPWIGSFFYGTPDGDVMELTGNKDIDDPIQYSMQFPYSDLGAPERFKRVHFMRPHIYSGYSDKYALCAVYDFEDAGTCQPGDADFNLAKWDSGIWDKDVWGGKLKPWEAVRGGTGIGILVSVVMKGEASTPLTVTGMGVLADTAEQML